MAIQRQAPHGNRSGVARIAERDRSLDELVAERAVERPYEVAIEDGERRLTYAELHAAGAGIAAGLRAAGIGDEEPVGICLPRSWQAVAAFLGVARAGGAYVPVSPDYPADRRRRMLDLVDAKALALSGDGDEEAAAPGGDRLAYVLFTSGSTGDPKGVEVTHRSLVHLLRSAAAVVPRCDDVVLHVVPLEFDVSALEVWGALLNGARLVIAPRGRPDPRELGRLISARDITFLAISTGLVHELTRAALPDLGGLRIVVAIGDVLSPAVATELCSTHPSVRLINGYGPTEATIMASAFEFSAPGGETVPIGRPLPGYRLHLLDDAGRPTPRGEAGELWIGGEGVARGYRSDPERTAERFREDPFEGGTMYRSGDLARMRSDGELVFLGRVDDQVKISGHRVEPGEVERALVGHPDVREAAVVTREDVPGHKRLVGYVARRPGSTPAPEDLRTHLEARLPAFMVPDPIAILDALPLNGRGKVDRAALPAPERRKAPQAPMEARAEPIARLMAEVLELDSVGPGEDFFELGGSSLLAIRLVGLLRDRLGAEVGIGAVFEAPTAAALAAWLERDPGRAPALPPLRPGRREATAPLTAAQRRGWLFGRTHPESIAYQFAAIFRFEGQLDEAALAPSLAAIVRRHEALRTGFEDRDGAPVQVIRRDCPPSLETLDLRGEGHAAWARLARQRVRTQIDPARPPLARWTLARLGERSWALIHVEHHLIHDGWSFAVLAGELAELYSAQVEGRPPALQPLAVQLQDYARWERAANQSDEMRRQILHWAKVLDRDPPLLDLPVDRPRPTQESFLGGSVRRRLGPDLAGRLRDLANAGGATLFMATFAAFLLQLQRYSGRDDLQVGSGLANRRDHNSERLIGMIVNTVAMRCDLGGDPTVRELLGRVRRTALSAYGNADAPFDAVVEALRPPRDPRRSPLIQALFSFHDAPRGAERWAGLQTRLVQVIPNGTAKADLNVVGVDDGDGGVTFVWEHSDLFDDATADRFAGHHLRLLEQFAAQPDARLSELDLLSAGERRELEAWSVNFDEYDRGASVPKLVEARARRDPGAVAVIDGTRRLTYGELSRDARAVAGTLRARGVGRGDLVGVLLPRSASSIVANLGVLAVGATYVPLDPTHPPARIARALADAGAGLLLTDPALGLEPALGAEVLDISEAATGKPIEAPLAEPDDLAYVIYTSGSTGEPKGVEVTHRNVVRLVDDPGFAELGAGTTMLHAASPAFDAATLEMWGPLANGGTIVTLGEHPSPDTIAAAIEAHGVTTLWLTAGLFHELVDRRPDCLGRVRHLLAGGDVLSPPHVARALGALPPDARLTNGYGPTETTTFALTHELRPGDPVSGPIPLGRPIQGTTCDVLDAGGRRAPAGVAGELWIGGDGVARGYRGDPVLTADRFRPDPERPGGRRYRSGDRVRRRHDGTFEFLGRLDRQVKVRGVRVEPAEVEMALRAHPAIADAAVIASERGAGGLSLVAYVVSAAGSQTPDAIALRAHAEARLPAAMVPSAWVTLPRLPLTPNGKLDRDRLPTPTHEHLAIAAAIRRPRGRAERRGVKAFEEGLCIRPVGAEDDFFALGGHSLLAVELFAKLERIGGRRLPLSTIFEASTPRALAARLAPDAAVSRWDNLVALKPRGTRPPLFVVGAGDGNIVGFGPLARQLSAEQPLYALQPSGLDGRHPLDNGIEAMARRYLEKVRSVQPRGPFLLAGRCNGATVAYEMAQQLHGDGEEVPLLLAIDSDPPPGGPYELAPGIPYDAMMESAWVRARQGGENVPDLDAPGGASDLAAWLRAPVGPGVSRYLYELHMWRPDLRAAWPDPLGADGPPFAAWAWDHGVHDHLVSQLLIPSPTDGCRPPGWFSWDWAMASTWQELGEEPIDPLSPAGWSTFRERLIEPIGEGRVNRYLLGAWRQRPDLQDVFPEPLGGDGEALLAWAWLAGVNEGLSPSFLPAAIEPLPARHRAGLLARQASMGVARSHVRASRRLRGLIDEGRARAIDAMERGLGRPLPGARQRTERHVVGAARKARATYRAKPWPGRVVLVTSPEFADKPAYAAWEVRAAGGVDRRPLPVGHVEMLREGGARLLADCLEQCIEEALTATGTTATP